MWASPFCIWKILFHKSTFDLLLRLDHPNPQDLVSRTLRPLLKRIIMIFIFYFENFLPGKQYRTCDPIL